MNTIDHYAERIGRWTLRNPMPVIAATTIFTGSVLGFNIGGTDGLTAGALASTITAATIAYADHDCTTLGPHH